MDMREKIARAIAERRNARRVKDGGEDIGVLPIDFADAGAVLAAMMEPTPEMWFTGEDGVAAWQAMLNAAAK